MADLKISAATLASALGGTEGLPGLQSAAPVRVTPELIRAYILGTQAGHRNIAGRNGGLEVWQRATSHAIAASTVAYTADGWYLATAASQASVVDRVAGIADASRYAARVRRNSGQTGTGVMRFAFALDEDEVVRLRGQRVVLSFRVSAGANWSPASGTLSFTVYTGTGAVAKRNASAYTSEATPVSGSLALTPGGAAVSAQSSLSTAIGATVTQAEIQFSWTPVGTAGAADDVTIDDVQLEAVPAGATTMPIVFERRPLADTLADCQRHLVAFVPGVTGAVVAPGLCYTTTDAQVPVVFQRPMRRVPTLVVSAGSDFQLLSAAGSGVTCTAVGTVTGNLTYWNLNVSVAAGLVAGNATQLQSATTGASLLFVAEI
jgi:hypothetical protein